MHNQPTKFIFRDWLQRILVFIGYYESNRELLINFFATMPNHVKCFVIKKIVKNKQYGKGG